MIKKKTILIVIFTLVVSSITIVFFINKTSVKRPQEPSKPYPYYSEEVTFQNTEAKITLAGTLTLPSKNGVHPAVILISGSGPQNRDEEVAGHRPFLIIADHLTRNGIAVLRYDDRGFGESTGEFKTAFLTDFATDVDSAIEYLNTRKEINKNKIGLIGHSEGGVVAPIVASSREDVSFMVLLASPGMAVIKVFLKQSELIPRSIGASETFIQKNISNNEKLFEMVLTSDNDDTLKNKLTKLLKKAYDETPSILIPEDIPKEEYISKILDLALSPHYKKILNFDPAPILQKVTCPVLALNGEKDIQITSKENLNGIYNALIEGGNMDVKIKEIPNLNHFFQDCETCTLAEYEKLEQTFSPLVLKEMSDWILEKVK